MYRVIKEPTDSYKKVGRDKERCTNREKEIEKRKRKANKETVDINENG